VSRDGLAPVRALRSRTRAIAVVIRVIGNRKGGITVPWRSRRRRAAAARVPLALVSLALLVGVTGESSPAGAATPAGTLTAPSSSVTWHESAAMTGSAPARRDALCAAPTHPCDDFNLTIDRGTQADTQVDIVVTPSAGNDMSIAIYPPGCPSGPTNPAACYMLYGPTVTILSPANGTYLIRMTCTTCAAATYAAAATLGPLKPFNLPAAGDQSFKWVGQQLAADATTPAGEPGISINKLGHVIVNSFGPTVWISTNDGATFGKPILTVDPICFEVSGDADAVVADDDTYYAANLCTAGPTNFSYSSTDGGKTWNPGAAGLPDLPGTTDSDRPWYALDPTDPAVLYFSYRDFAGPNIWVNKSVDHGKTWLQHVPITLGAPNFVDTGVATTSVRPLVDPTDPNTVIVFYTSNTAAKSALAPPTNDDFDLTQIFMAKSTDGGKTWANTLLFDAGATHGLDNTVAHAFSSAAIDSAGNAYVVFAERLGDRTETHIEYFAVPKGSTATVHPVQVDQGGLGANVFPWVAAGDAGRVDVTWYGSPAADNNDPAAQWSEMFAQTVNGLDAAPRFVQSRVSGNKPMHAADICLAGTLCLVTGGNRNLADFQMVGIDRCGIAQLVWTDDSRGTGYTMHARQTGGVSLRPAACIGVVAGPRPSGAVASTSGHRDLANTGGSAAMIAAATAAAALVLALLLQRGRRMLEGRGEL
jgi:hypothetical protein